MVCVSMRYLMPTIRGNLVNDCRTISISPNCPSLHRSLIGIDSSTLWASFRAHIFDALPNTISTIWIELDSGSVLDCALRKKKKFGCRFAFFNDHQMQEFAGRNSFGALRPQKRKLSTTTVNNDSISGGGEHQADTRAADIINKGYANRKRDLMDWGKKLIFFLG